MDKDNNDYLFILPQSLIFLFISISLSNLRFLYPSLHDSYYYLVTTLNVVQFNTLNPVLSSWYPSLNQQIHWPALHLFTTTLVFLTNIDALMFARFLLPLVGTIGFLIIFILVKHISNDNRIAMLTALISSINALYIYYNSEYHPQAFAPFIFFLMIYLYLKFKSSKNYIFGLLLCMTLLVFALSHHFSSLFIAVFAIIYISTIYTISNININKRFIFLNNFKEVIDPIKDYNFWILVAVAMISFHIFAYFNFISDLASTVIGTRPDLQLITYGNTVPILVTFTNTSKWIIFLFAIPSIYFLIKNKKFSIEQTRFFVLFFCFIIAGVVASTLVTMPLDRILIFFYPFVSFFAALTFFKFIEINKKRNYPINFLLIGIISLALIAGFFSSQSPAYFFKDSGNDPYYWFSNDPSVVDYYEIAGTWIKIYANSSKSFATEFDTRSPVFYFGAISSVRYYDPSRENYQLKNFKSGYVVLTPSIPYQYNDFNKTDYINSINTVYSDGKIIVGLK